MCELILGDDGCSTCKSGNILLDTSCSLVVYVNIWSAFLSFIAWGKLRFASESAPEYMQIFRVPKQNLQNLLATECYKKGAPLVLLIFDGEKNQWDLQNHRSLFSFKCRDIVHFILWLAMNAHCHDASCYYAWGHRKKTFIIYTFSVG